MGVINLIFVASFEESMIASIEECLMRLEALLTASWWCEGTVHHCYYIDLDPVSLTPARNAFLTAIDETGQ